MIIKNTALIYFGIPVLVIIIGLNAFILVQLNKNIFLANEIINSNPPLVSAPETITNKQDCENLGGTWQEAIPQNPVFCLIKYPDAGKACTDSSQCAGGCVITKLSEIGGKTGTCKADNDPQGCSGKIGDEAITCLTGDVEFSCKKNTTSSGCQAIFEDELKSPIIHQNQDCIEKEGGCCLGDKCTQVEIMCVVGQVPQFKGCDEKCVPIVNCVPENKK